MAVYRSSFGCLSSNFPMAMALVGFALLFQILLQCLGAFFGMSMREFNLEKEHTPATNETKSLDSMNLPILKARPFASFPDHREISQLINQTD